MSEVVRVQAEIRPGNSSGYSTFTVTDLWGKPHEGYTPDISCGEGWVNAVWLNVADNGLMIRLPGNVVCYVDPQIVSVKRVVTQWIPFLES